MFVKIGRLIRNLGWLPSVQTEFRRSRHAQDSMTSDELRFVYATGKCPDCAEGNLITKELTEDGSLDECARCQASFYILSGVKWGTRLQDHAERDKAAR